MEVVQSGLSSASSDAGAAQAVGATESSNPTTQDTSLASQGTASTPTAENVQGSQPSTTDADPFADLPSIDELKAQAGQGIKYADALASIKGAFDPLKSQFKELQQKYGIYESADGRFETPDAFNEVLSFYDSVFKWGQDPDTGEPVPDTEGAVQLLAQKSPQHLDFIVADALGMPTVDPSTGRQLSRLDYVLESLAADPEQRARVLKMMGGVEPSAMAPQWQPTEAELSVVRDEYKDLYRSLPYEERGELKMNSPEFINRFLQQEQFRQQLTAEKQQSDQLRAQEVERRETYLNQQAQAAGQEYLNTQLSQALTTFYDAVVQQCNFIKPLDMAQLPQGLTPEQATQLNGQIVNANKAEAVEFTGTIMGLLNPQVRSYIEPYLKQIGAVDDKLLQRLDAAANAFASNARNYGNLTYRQQLTANGNYAPDQSVTQMSNEAARALKTMVGVANEVFGRLAETRSSFFELRAQQHNSTLNNGAQVRPPISGQAFNPTTAPAPKPQGWMTRDELARLYG